MTHMTSHAVMKLLAAAGESGLTTTDLAMAFTTPDTHQKRSNRASSVLRTAAVNGYARRGDREPTKMPGAGGAPVYRWYATDTTADYVARGDRAETENRLAEWQRLSLEAIERRAAALIAAQTEMAERVAAGTVTKCWRYDTIVALRAVPCSLQEIGDVFGITRERVRQIELRREDICRCETCTQARLAPR